MLKTLLRVRMAALLAAFTGQSRKRKSQTKGKAVGYAFLKIGRASCRERVCLYV